MVEHLGIGGAEELLSLVERYYPRGQISPKTQYVIEEIFERLSEE